MTHPESIVFRYRPVGAASRRLVAEPRVDGWYVREEVWTGERWHTIGTEVADDVSVECGDVSEVVEQ